MGGLWRDVSECADDKLSIAHMEHRDRARLSALRIWSSLWERDRPQCGKRPSFDTQLNISSLLSSAMEKFSLV